MPLKFIIVPDSVEFKDLLSGNSVMSGDKPVTISFKQFVLKIVGHDHYMSSFDMLRSAHAIATAVANVNPGDMVTMSEDDWLNLCDGVKRFYSTFSLTPLGLIQLMPYFDAILKASDTPQK
jgi:hypothetical protein